MIVENPQSNINTQPTRPIVISVKKIFGILFAIMILSSTYDKSGIILGLGNRSIAVSIYKILFLGLVIIFLIDCALRPIRLHGMANRRIYWLLVVFVVIQTTSSLLGEFFASGEMALSSEVYYLIQRTNFLFIPLIAWRYNIAPKSVLKLFIMAIIVHYLFIALQFISPSTYMSFVERVADTIRNPDMTTSEYISLSTRPDNAFVWDRHSLDFFGLQRTGNYGTFVGAFGLLILGFSPRKFVHQVIISAFVLVSVFVVLMGGSRSVLIMTLVALLFFSSRSKLLSKNSSIILILGFSFSILFALVLFGGIPAESLTSVNAFFDPLREGSNNGKLAIAQYGLDLFMKSPMVGWGQRSFSAISLSVGNESFATSQAHSYVLSTVLSSGLIGFAAYSVLFVTLVKALWRRKEKDYIIVCSLFIGLGIYNIIYDAVGLDVFACFNGIAAYYALRTDHLVSKISRITSLNTNQ